MTPLKWPWDPWPCIDGPRMIWPCWPANTLGEILLSEEVVVSLIPSCWGSLLVSVSVDPGSGFFSSRSCPSFSRVHMFMPCEECWFSSLSHFIQHLIENNFILIIKYIDSCTEGGCFLASCFVILVLCVFLHTWRLHLMWMVNVLYSIWRCWSR